jgi:hypothetical protein
MSGRERGREETLRSEQQQAQTERRNRAERTPQTRRMSGVRISIFPKSIQTRRRKKDVQASDLETRTLFVGVKRPLGSTYKISLTPKIHAWPLDQ